MRSIKSIVLCGIAAAVLVACGGGGNGDQSPKVAFSSMVSFGDSLSDVGTYAVGGISAAAPTGGAGGKYTVNSSTAKNWTELLAAQIGQAAPCAAQTGLVGTTFGNVGIFGAGVTPAFHAGCLNYAQGGSRVTNPIGPGNVALGGGNALLGQLTIPVVTQVSRHLAIAGGTFSGTELVTVFAGGNDAIIQTATYTGTVGAGGNATTTAAAVVSAMTTAGTELATLIKNEIVAKGAKYVVVVNLPNVSKTPYGAQNEAALAGTRTVIDNMTTAFNTALSTGLASTSNVQIVDAYTISTDQAVNPSAYGLSNVTDPACSATGNILGSVNSLTCNTTNVITTADTSTYLFADAVHPTPFGYKLLAQGVTTKMLTAGWL